MTNHFSQRVNDILALSKKEAERLSCGRITPEVLLLGILRDKATGFDTILERMNVSHAEVKHALEERVRRTRYIGMPLHADEMTVNEMASNILRLAVLEARMQRVNMVDVKHVLLAILHDRSANGAKEVLEEHDVHYKDLLDALQERNVPSDGLELSSDDDESAFERRGRRSSVDDEERLNGRRPASKTPIVDNFSVDLTQAAVEGKLDPVVGRENEIERLSEILCRRKKNNPVLIGEPGVGKSAIVEGLAQLIARRRVSPILANKRLVSLDMAAMVAGTKYRGQFEERIHSLLKELEANPNIIIFVDEIHTIVGAGSSSGSMDAANIMKPALARGTVQCIGATTLDEYRNSIEKDGALERRFQKVIIDPTTAEETAQILRNIKERYEEHHNVTYSDEALAACISLSERYISDRCFPDKAIDVLDEVGSRVHLLNAEVPQEILDKEKQIAETEKAKIEAVNRQNFERAAQMRDVQGRLEKELADLNDAWRKSGKEHRETVTEHHVAEVVARMTGIPVQRMEESETARLRNMDGELRKSVVSQDDAITKIVKSIKRNRMGLRDPNRPVGAFMFLGPTGVGKTFLAKKLAEIMFGSADALIRIDMSEYNESFNVSRLVGSPPGYVGYEEGGQLTEKIRRKPYSIVLLDEIEKAHGSVFNILLQVLDEGRLTDGTGRTIDFRNTIIIMTSNAGARQLKDFGQGIGFNAATVEGDSSAAHERTTAIIKKSLEKLFAPEFLNRLDEIITFNALDRTAVRRIIDNELSTLLRRIDTIGIQLDVDDEAKNFLAEKGYDPRYGARPLKRAIQHYVEDPMCELLLDGTPKEGRTISVRKKSDTEELCFEMV